GGAPPMAAKAGAGLAPLERQADRAARGLADRGRRAHSAARSSSRDDHPRGRGARLPLGFAEARRLDAAPLTVSAADCIASTFQLDQARNETLRVSVLFAKALRPAPGDGSDVQRSPSGGS